MSKMFTILAVLSFFISLIVSFEPPAIFYKIEQQASKNQIIL